MIDFHTHLLGKASFGRLYDRVGIKLFGRRFGIDPELFRQDPYAAYTKALVSSANQSRHIRQIVLFGVDAVVDDLGNEVHRDPTVCAENDEVLRLHREHPELIIPFFSVNPMRPDALDRVDSLVAQGFRGAKFLQNYWGVNTREARYRPYFRKLAEHGIPLIVHVGSESSVRSVKACESLDMVRAPLDEGVSVVCAHMALSYEPTKIFKAFRRAPRHYNEEYFQLLRLLRMEKNLYADLSAMLTPVRAKALRHVSEQKELHHKLLFGTDYPVPFTTLFNSYDLPLKRRLELGREGNVFDRYVGAMKEYFPLHSPIYEKNAKTLLKP